jgi:hypothetical protein
MEDGGEKMITDILFNIILKAVFPNGMAKENMSRKSKRRRERKEAIRAELDKRSAEIKHKPKIKKQKPVKKYLSPQETFIRYDLDTWVETLEPSDPDPSILGPDEIEVVFEPETTKVDIKSKYEECWELL